LNVSVHYDKGLPHTTQVKVDRIVNKMKNKEMASNLDNLKNTVNVNRSFRTHENKIYDGILSTNEYLTNNIKQEEYYDKKRKLTRNAKSQQELAMVLKKDINHGEKVGDHM